MKSVSARAFSLYWTRFPVPSLLFVAVLLFVAACTFHSPVQAQESGKRLVELVYADSLTGRMEGTEQVRSLFGNVHFRQGDTQLWSDRATQYVEREEIEFLGRVRIVDQGDSLFSEAIHYDSRNKIGQARARVRLSDGEVTVFAPTGRYYIDEKRAFFDQGVTLVDSATTLVSKTGEYLTEVKRADFYGDVHLYETRNHVTADSITYFRETEVSNARGNVFIQRYGDDNEGETPDSTRRTYLFGETAFNDNKEGYSRVEGNPLLVRIEVDSIGAEADTMLVRAVILEASRKDSLNRLVATDSVRIWGKDMASVSDSLVYDRIVLEDTVRHEEFRIYQNPAMWFKETQVTGDTVRVTLVGGDVDSLYVRNNAFVAQRDSVLDRIRQLRGMYMVGLFEEDSLRSLEVRPNAELIHYLANDEDKPDGAVRSAADRMYFTFQGDELKQVRAVAGVQGTYYAEGLIPNPFQLTGFLWIPERRPTRDGLITDPSVFERIRQSLTPETLADSPPGTDPPIGSTQTNEPGTP